MTTIDDIAKRLDRLETLITLSKNVLTIAEVAMMTGYTVKYLRLLISRREIPYYRRGNRLFFNRVEVEGWMQEQRIPSNQEIMNQAAQYSRNINKSNNKRL